MPKGTTPAMAFLFSQIFIKPMRNIQAKSHATAGGRHNDSEVTALVPVATTTDDIDTTGTDTGNNNSSSSGRLTCDHIQT